MNNSIPSLVNMCIITLAEIKYHSPETTIPFNNIPSNIINELCYRLIMSDNQINIKQPPDGKILKICVSHKASVKELVTKIAEALKVPLLHIRLIFNLKATSGFDEQPICDFFRIKVGESATAYLTYMASNPGQNFPEWPK
jgi:hypothetical protein